jgi:hypothetical protein
MVFKKRFENDSFSWRLFVTDKYLTLGQVVCFLDMLKFIPCNPIETADKSCGQFYKKLGPIVALQNLENLFFIFQPQPCVSIILNSRTYLCLFIHNISSLF